MKNFWDALEQNEKRLIVVAVLLTLAITAYQFVLTPLMGMRDRAKSGYALSMATRADIRQMTEGYVSSDRPQSKLPLQAVVTDTASVFGLSINRLAPVDANSLNLWLEDANAQSIYFWALDMSQTHGIQVERALVRREDNGLVSATLLVSRGE